MVWDVSSTLVYGVHINCRITFQSYKVEVLNTSQCSSGGRQVCPEYLGFFGVPEGTDERQAQLTLEATWMQRLMAVHACSLFARGRKKGWKYYALAVLLTSSQKSSVDTSDMSLLCCVCVCACVSGFCLRLQSKKLILVTRHPKLPNQKVVNSFFVEHFWHRMYEQSSLKLRNEFS